MYNSRDYFTAHRAEYERAVRAPLYDLLTDLSAEFGGTVKLFRQNRDVRFSADKRPYKANASGVLMDRPGTSAALYVAVSADGLQAATGYYGLASDQLVRFRHALTAGEDVVAVGEELRGILGALTEAGWEVDGAAMKGMPRGVAKDVANADLVRCKSLTVGGSLEPERMCDASVTEWVAGIWRAAGPMNAWLDRHVGASTLLADSRGR